MIGRVVAVLTGLILLTAAIASWWIAPPLTAILVGLAVVLLTGWQWYRRRAGIPRAPATGWTMYVWPLTFGALAVTALNGWIYRISADAGGDATNAGTLLGLAVGVVFMAAAYGYGRVRAQRVQLTEQQYGGAVDADADDEPDEEWFFPVTR